MAIDPQTGLARREALVRHLVMPGPIDAAAQNICFLHDEVSPETYVNIMGQYRPEHRFMDSERYVDNNRRPTRSRPSFWLAETPD